MSLYTYSKRFKKMKKKNLSFLDVCYTCYMYIFFIWMFWILFIRFSNLFLPRAKGSKIYFMFLHTLYAPSLLQNDLCTTYCYIRMYIYYTSLYIYVHIGIFNVYNHTTFEMYSMWYFSLRRVVYIHTNCSREQLNVKIHWMNLKCT